MIEKQDFMELLSDIREYQKAQTHEMTREEIREYFDGITLNDAQIEMIYDYLREPEEEMSGQDAPEGEDALNKEAEKEDDQYVKTYLEELSYLKEISLEERLQSFRDLSDLSGAKKERAKEVLVSAYLAAVIPIAKEYTGKGMLLSDLIQEGNLGLMTALEQFEAEEIVVTDSLEEAEEYVKRSVREAMLSVLNLRRYDKDKESELVAKTALLYEAKKALAEENARSATMEELSEYTKIPVDEIMDIERLMKED